MNVKSSLVAFLLLISTVARAQQSGLKTDWGNLKSLMVERCEKVTEMHTKMAASQVFPENSLENVRRHNASLKDVLMQPQYDRQSVRNVLAADKKFKSAFVTIILETEQYPELKTDQAFVDLLSELMSIELDLSEALPAYNEKCKKAGREDLAYQREQN